MQLLHGAVLGRRRARSRRLPDERIELNAAGQVELELETPWRGGTTHIVMSPLDFMQRLAALVPRPRLHLISFHPIFLS
ncbi:MAG TPA: transposase [Rubrivivax sp.]|nr:transposase [Rubrivivax sp.]